MSSLVPPPPAGPALTEDTAVSALRRTWQPVANAADLPPGKVLGYTLLNTELVIARFADRSLLAADVACPHKGARLSAGCIRGGELVCPYHGWRFNQDGFMQALAERRGRKLVVVLNFPNNPSGYQPTRAEARKPRRSPQKAQG